MQKKTITYFSFLIFLPFILNIFVNFQKRTTFITIIFLSIFLFIYKEFFSDLSIYQKSNLVEKVTSNNLINLFFLFLITFITQNKYLHIETITWDVPSYLVASQEINRGFIPMETQWESKGPFFFYLYNLISNIAGGNLVYFKLLNDVILFVSSVLLYFSFDSKHTSKSSALLGSLIFILITSHIWFVSELSELYCLIFISLSFLIYKRLSNQKYFFLFIGLCISFATLINQGTAIFIIPYSIIIFKGIKSKRPRQFLNFITGLIIPQSFFIILYWSKSLLELYISQYIQLPLNYVQSSSPSLGEIFVIFRRYFDYDYFLYFIFIVGGIFVIHEYFKNSNKSFLDIEFTSFMTGLLIYFIAGHSYQHHLFYTIFFFSALCVLIQSFNKKIFLIMLVVLSSFSIISKAAPTSIYNLLNISEIYERYPLKRLSSEIDSRLSVKDYDILALDHVLILYYLNKPNFSYIVHPSNHNEEYIVKELLRIERIKTNELNHVSYLIEKEPEVILCNSKIISNGEVKKIDFYNCAVDDYKKNYKRIDTSIYRYDENLNYYFDPYKEISLFIKDF